MGETNQTIPRPLVRTNQWVLFSSVLSVWISGVEWILLIPLLSGLSGLLLKYNPIMEFAKLFLKRPYSKYIAEDKQQQKFNQWIATILLTIAFGSYLMGMVIIGHIASLFVAIASFVAILGFCVGCFIRYKWSQYQYKRLQKGL
ncbi:DUF4395 domain-containing protein [Bacillus sp. Marseille-Q3570]|uniref:DUF4395 domain-containing protein n=1 Tax=Bacillus sp. Marseille-Q3570 TaxID=2963522 RepID=UPI0021B7F545|nr:DUF4395 domain-containing protein [Bacillus sp. Marseille-Q3570]